MAFIVGGALVGIVVLHSNHSDYSDWRDHSNHSNHRNYGDSALRNEISTLENNVRTQESEVERLKNQMNENYRNRINQLKNEKNYSGLSNQDVLNAVKSDMKREIENEISRDKQELEQIDKMISRINELELQATRR